MSNDVQSRIGALVDLGDTDVGVFIYSDAPEQNISYGEILLLTWSTLRMFSLARNSDLKRSMLKTFGDGDVGLINALPGMLQKYAEDYKQKVPSIKYKADGNTKRGFTMVLPFSEGRHATQLKPRGFGILGKNIEASAFLAVALTHDYLSNKYSNDKKMIDDMNDALIDCSEALISRNGKLSIREEFDFTESITNTYRKLHDV